MSSLVGAKGQVTIEKGIRDALGLQPGWRAVQRLEGDRVVIEFLPPKHRRSLDGILSDKTTVRIRSLEEWLRAPVVATEEELADLEWFLKEREAMRQRDLERLEERLAELEGCTGSPHSVLAPP